MSENLGAKNQDPLDSFFGSLESKMRELAEHKGISEDKIKSIKQKMNKVMDEIWPDSEN